MVLRVRHRGVACNTWVVYCSSKSLSNPGACSFLVYTLAFSPPPSSSHALHPKSLTSPSPQAPANLSPKPPPHPTPLPRPPGDLRRHHRAHLPYISPIPPYISPTSAGDLRRHPRAHRQPGLSLGQVAAAPAADVRTSPLHLPMHLPYLLPDVS